MDGAVGFLCAVVSGFVVEPNPPPRSTTPHTPCPNPCRCPPQPAALPALLPLIPALLRDPPAWGRRHRHILSRLVGGASAEAAVRAATGRQLGAVAEACGALAYGGVNSEVLQWIGSAALRLGRGCALAELVRVGAGWWG